MYFKKRKKVFLIFDKNIIFKGDYFGINKNFSGNIIFNTSNIGYEEVITDPSYLNKIVVLTTPYIGNTGINFFDSESDRIWLSILLVRNITFFSSNCRCKINFFRFIKVNNFSVIYNIDIRGIVYNIKIRNKISIYYNKFNLSNCIPSNKNIVIKNNNIYLWNKTDYLNYFYNIKFIKKILVLDLGLKFNILRKLSKSYFLIITNSYYFINNVFYNIFALLFSSGPGDPRNYNYLKNIFFKYYKQIPILGICLGHQIILNFLGYKIKEMGIGHHGINHPIIYNNNIYISSQNHDYKVIGNNKRFIYSKFDNSIQGYINYNTFIISMQGHPEGGPGPSNINIFRNFLNLFNE